MKTRLGRFLAILSMLGLLASCAQMSSFETENADTLRAAQNASTYADHDSLAKQYENAAKEMRVKAEEQNKLLEHYEDKSYLYGRRAQDLQAHTSALLRRYQQFAEENLRQAAYHQKMASELGKSGHASQGSSRENEVSAGTDRKDWNGSSGKAL
jgi:predicted ribosome quality control (RQC) complex YloA/Tae2 family protein